MTRPKTNNHSHDRPSLRFTAKGWKDKQKRRASEKGTKGLSPSQQSQYPGLSTRQTEVVILAARGLCDCEIAAELGLAENTVGAYLQAVYKKLDVHSRAALAVRLLGARGSGGVT
jgi:DNA-binding NarL/FixJ family response regulator